MRLPAALPALLAPVAAASAVLAGCSTLMVGELGYSAHNGPADGDLMHGATGGYHMGVGLGPVEMGIPHGGMGFSGRFRTYGSAYSTVEPGIHGYGMIDLAPTLSLYLRGTGYAGLSFLPERPGLVVSPVVQPGTLLCPPDRIGWCLSISAPVGYDLAPRTDRPGWTTGLNMGIGWGNTFGQ